MLSSVDSFNLKKVSENGWTNGVILMLGMLVQGILNARVKIEKNDTRSHEIIGYHGSLEHNNTLVCMRPVLAVSTQHLELELRPPSQSPNSASQPQITFVERNRISCHV